MVYTAVYWFYMDTRVEREEAHSASDLRAAVRRVLCARTTLHSRCRRLPGQPVAYWNWKLFRQNNAAMNLLGTLVVWVVVAGWLLLR